jgi:hypothetical protein
MVLGNEVFFNGVLGEIFLGRKKGKMEEWFWLGKCVGFR